VWFAALAVLFAVSGFVIVAIASISVCSMQPDFAATCDARPVEAVFALVGIAYVSWAIWYVRTKLLGGD
jgi:hypothetical protein